VSRLRTAAVALLAVLVLAVAATPAQAGPAACCGHVAVQAKPKALDPALTAAYSVGGYCNGGTYAPQENVLVYWDGPSAGKVRPYRITATPRTSFTGEAVKRWDAVEFDANGTRWGSQAWSYTPPKYSLGQDFAYGQWVARTDNPYVRVTMYDDDGDSCVVRIGD
jgi:hypothetical protein